MHMMSLPFILCKFCRQFEEIHDFFIHIVHGTISIVPWQWKMYDMGTSIKPNITGQIANSVHNLGRIVCYNNLYPT